MPRLKKRPDGRYQKKVTLPDGTQKFVYGTSDHAVNKKAEEIKKAYETGVDLNDATTVIQWAAEWLKTYKSGLKETTKSNYLILYNTHIAPKIGGLKLKDVKPLHIQGIMNGVASKSESLQKKVLLVLNQMMDAARDNGLIAASPCKGVKISKVIREEKIKFLTEEQQTDIINRVTDNQARAFCALCLYAGLRRGEALALQWSDIEDGYINVCRNRVFVDNQAETDDTPKSKSGYRKLPVIKKLQEILDDTKKVGITVIANAASQPLSKSGFRRLWDKVEAAIEFNKAVEVRLDGATAIRKLYNVHPHMLRHTYCTILYNAKVDLKTAQVLMGHSSIAITAQIYTHIQQKNIADSGKKIDEYLAPKKKRVVKWVVKNRKTVAS